MRFTLVYDGPLPAQTSHNGRAAVKHSLREAFHRQLAELWKERPPLVRYLTAYKAEAPDLSLPSAPSDASEGVQVMTEMRRDLLRADRDTRRGIIVPATRGSFIFVPLATKNFDLVCHLDILFLRAEPPGTLFPNQAGDLDNRLKVLFDALRIPDLNELPATARPSADQAPFFCLLQDDKLITSFRLESERLLDEAAGGNRVQLVIHVTMKTRHVNWTTIELEGD